MISVQNCFRFLHHFHTLCVYRKEVPLFKKLLSEHGFSILRKLISIGMKLKQTRSKYENLEIHLKRVGQLNSVTIQNEISTAQLSSFESLTATIEEFNFVKTDDHLHKKLCQGWMNEGEAHFSIFDWFFHPFVSNHCCCWAQFLH